MSDSRSDNPKDESPDPALAFAFLNEIGIIEQLSSNRLQRLLPAGLSMAGFTVLNHFARLNKVTEAPAKLASAFQVTKGAMTNTLQRLEAMGLIEIVSDMDDGRAKRVSVTPAGASMLTRVLGILEPELAFIIGEMGTQTLASALPVLARLRQLLDENR